MKSDLGNPDANEAYMADTSQDTDTRLQPSSSSTPTPSRGVEKTRAAQQRSQPSLLRVPANRQHRFVVLDGFRGLAALSVVAYHAGTALGLGGLAGRAYLAVDFFFVLSGFVLAHAYEGRLRDGKLSPSSFLAIRFRRLWPIAAAGTVLGIVATIRGVSGMPFGGASRPSTVAAFFFALLLLPDLVPGAPAFPLNPPHWSIFLEIAANYVYALFAPMLSRRALTAVIPLAGIWLLVDTFVAGSANHIAPARVAYGFFVGVAIYRAWAMGVRPFRLGPVALGSVLLICLFAPPILGVAITDAVTQLIAFPLIVWGGASAVTERGRALCTWSGRLSYPVYALHYPILMAVIAYLSR